MTTTIEAPQQAPDTDVASPRVRTDLVVGVGLLAAVVVGRLLWQASDLGIVAAFGAR